ncbi:DnaJ [Acrasis kona]|uniref:DnaJ n=1 Tax=Acrasis kona TaxID=1008807 RepID=A0AAW2YZF7_9EUKA
MSQTSYTPYGDDILGRHYVIMKTKIFKDKPRILVIKNSGFELVQTIPPGIKRSVEWSNVRALRFDQEHSRQVIIEYNTKDKKTLLTDTRCELLAHFFSAYKSIDSQRYDCQKITKCGKKVPVVLSLDSTSYKTITTETNAAGRVHPYHTITCIECVNAEETTLVIHLTHGHVQRFEVDSIDKLKMIVQRIKELQERYLGRFEPADYKIFNSNEVVPFKKLTSEILATVRYDTIVDRIKQPDRLIPRRILLTDRTIIEAHVEGDIISSEHKLGHINNLIRLDERNLIIEYNTNFQYHYSQEVMDDLITSILELADRAKLLLNVRNSIPLNGIRVGHPNFVSADYDDYIITWLSVAIKPQQMSQPESWKVVLLEFIDNYQLKHFSQHIQINQKHSSKERKAFQSLLAMLRHLVSSDAGKNQTNLNDLYILVLSCMQRLLILPEVFEDVQKKDILEQLLRVLYPLRSSSDPMVIYMCSQVLRFSVDQLYERKNNKKELTNKINLFQPTPERDPMNVIFDHFLSTRIQSIGKNGFTLAYHSVLSLLENLMFSGAYSTDRHVFVRLVQYCRSHADDLFTLSFDSPSLSLRYNAALLLRVVLQYGEDEKAHRNVKYRAVHTVQLLQQILLASSGEQDPIRAAVNAENVGYLSEGYKEAMFLLRRIFSPTLIKKLTLFNDTKNTQHGLIKKIQGSSEVQIPVQPYNKLSQNWKMLFSSVMGPESKTSSANLIWDERTQKELITRLQTEISQNDKLPENVVWNHEEFNISYECLSNEPQVGKYYLRFFLSPRFDMGWGDDAVVDNPVDFIEQLHDQIMLSPSDAMVCLCLRVATCVYMFHKQEIGPYPYMHHICELLKDRSHQVQSQYQRMLVLVDVLNFVRQLLVNSENIESFVRFGGIQIILGYISMIHGQLPDVPDKVDLNGTIDSTTPLIMSALNYQEHNSINPNRISDQPNIHVTVIQSSVRILLGVLTHHPDMDHKDRIIVPMPVAKNILSTPNIIPHLIQLLLFGDHGNMFIFITQLLKSLIMYNDDLIPELYRTGLFYLLFLYDGSSIEDMVQILQYAHRAQSSETSILSDILPDQLIYRLDTWSVQDFCTAYQAQDICTPDIIWNAKMRCDLKNIISSHLSNFINVISQDQNAIYQYEPLRQPVIYERLMDEPVCAHYYLNNLMDTSTWPSDFKIQDATILQDELILQLDQSITKQNWDHASKCLRCLLLVMNHTDHTTFKSFSSHFAVILKCCNCLVDSDQLHLQHEILELIHQLMKLSKENSVGLIKGNVINPIISIFDKISFKLSSNPPESSPDGITPNDKLQNYFENRKIAILQKDLARKSLHHEREDTMAVNMPEEDNNVDYDGNQMSSSGANPFMTPGDDYTLAHLSDPRDQLAHVASQCVKLILFVSQNYHESSSGQLQQSLTLMKSVVSLCMLPYNETTKECISISLDTLSSLFKDPSLQERALTSGALVCTLIHALNASDSEIALKGSRSTRRMAGWRLPNDDSSVSVNLIVDRSLRTLLPDHLCACLMNRGDSEFYELFNQDESTITVMWNQDSRNELLEFLHSLRLNMMMGNGFDVQLIHDFKYHSHDHEPMSCGVFL